MRGFLPMMAFGFKEEESKKKTVIKNLDACVVFCRVCEDICPAGGRLPSF